jgi:hypothetical protein
MFKHNIISKHLLWYGNECNGRVGYKTSMPRL